MVFEISKATFRFYTSEEIRNMGVVSITNPQSLDQLGKPTPNGLYDVRMGPIERFIP